jgi:hypothetical protein
MHTIELTLLGANKFPEDKLLLTVWNNGAPVGATLQTPPYPLACDGIPVDAMDVVAAQLVVAPLADRRPRRAIQRRCLR